MLSTQSEDTLGGSHRDGVGKWEKNSTSERFFHVGFEGGAPKLEMDYVFYLLTFDK